MGKQSIHHLLGIGFAFVAERCIGFVQVLLIRGTSTGEECNTTLDVEVHEVEDDSMRKISKADIVVLDTLTGVDHLDEIEIILGHRLKVRNLHIDSLEIQLCGLVGVHINKLILVSEVRQHKFSDVRLVKRS